jgi:hypothetical protein
MEIKKSLILSKVNFSSKQENEQLAKETILAKKENSEINPLISKAYISPQIYTRNQIEFTGYKKIMEKILKNSNNAKVHLSYDEVCVLLEHLGYKIRTHSSHTIANKTNNPTITFVHPHRHEDSIHPETIKILKGLILEHNSDIKTALT